MGYLLLSPRNVVVIDALALEHLEPRGAFHILVTVLVQGDVELGLLVVAQDLGGHEQADFEPRTWLDGLLVVLAQQVVDVVDEFHALFLTLPRCILASANYGKTHVIAFFMGQLGIDDLCRGKPLR